MLSSLSGSGAGDRKKLAEAARLWARGDFSSDADQAQAVAQVDEALAVWGLVAEIPAIAQIESFYLWPENLPAWQIFQGCRTQWRSSMGGREGLDYSGVQIVMQMHRVKAKDRGQRFAEVQVMEFAALNVWAEKQEKQN